MVIFVSSWIYSNRTQYRTRLVTVKFKKDTDINNKPQEINNFIPILLLLYLQFIHTSWWQLKQVVCQSRPQRSVDATDGRPPEKHSFLPFSYIYFNKECHLYQTNPQNIKHHVDSFTNSTKMALINLMFENEERPV